jgi:hypothetical protein
MMPSAVEASSGETILFNNIGSSVFTVKDQGGNTLLSVGAGQQWQLYLTSNATVNGIWRSYQFGASTSTTNAASLQGYGIKAISTTLNQKINVVEKSSNYTIIDSDRASLLNWTGGAGTLTLPLASTVGDDWFVQIRNSGSGSITVNGVSLIDSVSSKTYNPGDSSIIISTGTQFLSLGFGQNSTFAFDYTVINVGGGVDYTLSGSELNRISYKFTGVLTANINVIVPATVQQYWLTDATTGAFTLSVKTAAQVSPSIVQDGLRNIYFCDGTDILPAVTVSLTPGATISAGTF